MRKKTAAAACVLLALCLGGCREETVEQTAVPVEETAAVTTTAPAETTVPVETTVPAATTEPAETASPTETTEPAETTAPAAELPYLQKVTFADQSIYSGPGYDYSFAGTVRVAGTYTIVEEVRDEEGNLWGRLKSGAGWIDLTQVRERLQNPPVMTANYADPALLDSGVYHHYVRDTSEYAVRIAFRVTETVKDVTLYSVILTEDMEQLIALMTLPELTADQHLVADLDFPGDMSSYAISFTDSSGITRLYHIYVSGRNGALVLTER